MENSREVPKKIKNRMPCDPEISFLHIYLKETKTVTQKDIGTHIFSVALFTITKIMEATYMSIDRWMDKQDAILLCHKEWNLVICNDNYNGCNSEGIMLSEMSEKDKYHMISLLRWV